MFKDRKVKKNLSKVNEKHDTSFYDTKVSLNNWSKLIDIMKKISSTELVENDEYFYFKIFYENSLTIEDKNEIFVSISSLPLSEDHVFLGVKEYLENHEMCFVFKKR